MLPFYFIICTDNGRGYFTSSKLILNLEEYKIFFYILIRNINGYISNSLTKIEKKRHSTNFSKIKSGVLQAYEKLNELLQTDRVVIPLTVSSKGTYHSMVV